MSAHTVLISANFMKCSSVYAVHEAITEIISSFCCIKIRRNVKIKSTACAKFSDLKQLENNILFGIEMCS